MVSPTAIRRATLADLDLVAPLFDAYRRFYRFSPDAALARTFLEARLQRNESVVFLATAPDDSALGFTQLYPSFSSGAAARIFVLNDLFVAPTARRLGVGRALLRAAASFGRAEGAVRLTLSTELTNHDAQALYESEGWLLQTAFCDYALSLA